MLSSRRCLTNILILWMKMIRLIFLLASTFRTHFCANNNTIIGTFVLLFSIQVFVIDECRTMYNESVVHRDNCNVSRLVIMNILLFVFRKHNAIIWHERRTIKILKIDYCSNRFGMHVQVTCEISLKTWLPCKWAILVWKSLSSADLNLQFFSTE